MCAYKPYLTLKEAARILGIHEQTIRNWERRGIIHPVRLPGSRIRRIPATEIERVKAQMHAGQRTAGTVRLDPPCGDAALIAQGRAQAEDIKRDLAASEPPSLEDTMYTLRGRSWSS
ncbi:MAG: helix-turn-helix domain-containing protein [Anaerolineae bacterium]|nr:helix-turn-helix domain-containing protein [Anaerolineae bacterium]